MHRLVVVIAIAGCGAPKGADDTDAGVDAGVAPVFRNPVSLPDEELVTAALKILGGPVPGSELECNGCHGLTRQKLRNWRTLSDTAMASCLTDLAVESSESAQKMIDCTRAMPELATSDFQTTKLGVYTTATKLPWFAFVFSRAYGDAGMQKLAEFQRTIGMPRGDIAQLTQDQFDIVAEWFARSLPLLDETVPEQQPQSCAPSISADVAAHVSAMQTSGWRAVNRINMMAMYGCGSATDPRQCLTDKPFATDQPFGTGWELPGRGRVRVLRDVTYSSEFWTRSSPDGRFVAHGVLNMQDSYVIDLQRGVDVSIAAQYDPAFFPDNSGFVFLGGTHNVCAISVLTANPASISMDEPGCSKIDSIGLYEHVGRALGGDFFAIKSQFESDDGGRSATHDDPLATFTAAGYTDFTPMMFDGSKYVSQAPVSVLQPFEGDATLSPSAGLEMTRLSGPNDKQIGFVLRKVNATLAASTYTITTPEIARYCISGGKPGFSYDERWVAFHHYVTDADAQELGFSSANDPGFADYKTKGAANLYLMELRTGVPIRITNMQPGQYALFPHFRSDGWIYAQIRDMNAGHEYTVASDAALVLE